MAGERVMPIPVTHWLPGPCSLLQILGNCPRRFCGIPGRVGVGGGDSGLDMRLAEVKTSQVLRLD